MIIGFILLYIGTISMIYLSYKVTKDNKFIIDKLIKSDNEYN